MYLCVCECVLASEYKFGKNLHKHNIGNDLHIRKDLTWMDTCVAS